MQQKRPDLFISEDNESDDSNVVGVRPKVEPKTEPYFTPFVDIDGNVLIKTETDDTPFVDDGNILIKTETDGMPLIDINGDILIKEETPTDIYISSDIDSSDDDQTIPYVGDSDTENITYATTPRDKRYEIYRKKAKKKALKRLAKKRAKQFKNKNKNKTFTPFVDVDGNVLIKTQTDDMPFVDNGNILIKTETDDTPLIDINGDILIKEETPTDIYVGSDIDSSDDDQTIPYVGDSDTETITYATAPRVKDMKYIEKKLKRKRLRD